MQENGLDGSLAAADHCIDFSKIEEKREMGNSSVGELPQNSAQAVVSVGIPDGGSCNSVAENGRGKGQTLLGEIRANSAQTVIAVVISNGVVNNQTAVISGTRGSVVSNGEDGNPDSVPLEPHGSQLDFVGAKVDQVFGAVSSAKKGSLSRSESFDEQCRVCQHSSEEALIDLGCQCRGGLAKAHRSCIDTWFRTRGSNKCEICQQEATNVSPPESQPSRNYWVWRIDPTFRGSGMAPEGERFCYSPLWVAFSILIGGLMLDVLISISLGVSALPVNIIIGVLVVLGLGTALRLALECCHEMSMRRAVHRADTTITLSPLGYHPAV